MWTLDALIRATSLCLTAALSLGSLTVGTLCPVPTLKLRMLLLVSVAKNYMRELLRDFGFAQSALTQIYENNLARVAMSENPVRRRFPRYIGIRLYFVRAMVSAVVLKLVPLHTHSTVAAVLQMPLPRAYHLQRISSIVRSCWATFLFSFAAHTLRRTEGGGG
jgi:hypothetical protein